MDFSKVREQQKKKVESLPKIFRSYFEVILDKKIPQEYIRNEFNLFIQKCDSEMTALDNIITPKPEEQPLCKYDNKKILAIHKILEDLKISLYFEEKGIYQERIGLLYTLKIFSEEIIKDIALFIIPITKLLDWEQSKYVLKAKNKISTLELYEEELIIQDKIQKSCINSCLSTDISPLIAHLYSIKDPESNWYPRNDISEMLENFVRDKYSFKGSLKHSDFLDDIIKQTQKFCIEFSISKEYFPTCYLLFYRSAFDAVYPQYFGNIVDPNMKFPHPPTISFPKEIEEEKKKGIKILNTMILETNPIDIGYCLTSLSPIFANMINIKQTSEGKGPAKFISADQCIDSMQVLLYESDFIQSFEIIELISKFAASNDYPEAFKYMCNCFKAAVIGLLEVPMKKR